MKKRILIAEDDRLTREMIVNYAETEGYETASVEDGVELLDTVSQQSFDLIITDLMMKDLNGASASEILKIQDNPTPVIAITALNEAETELVNETFCKIFRKPCNFAEIFGYIKSII